MNPKSTNNSGMKCPECGAISFVQHTKTVENMLVRRRECFNEHRFISHETILRMVKRYKTDKA